MDSTKRVYLFTEDATPIAAAVEGDGKELKDLLGGKGSNLMLMTNAGIPGEVTEAVAALEAQTGKKFGDVANPLLLSVRSGAKFSMPGMMDTVLNLGLNDDTVEAVAANTHNERFAWDCYRRFIQMFGDVVLEVEHYIFEHIIEIAKEKQGVQVDSELSPESLKWMVKEYKKKIERKTGKPFPMDPREQLKLAVLAVFRSWNNDRAKFY